MGKVYTLFYNCNDNAFREILLISIMLFRVSWSKMNELFIGRQLFPDGIFCMRDGSACFKLSNVIPDIQCEIPISNVDVCKMIGESNVFERSSYQNLTGDGHDLPYGCILDTLHFHSSHGLQKIYWNPKGVAISRDKNIRQICFSGRCFFLFQ